MKTLLRQPAFWLAVLAAFSFANAFVAHQFRPVKEPDTATYEDFDWSSLSGVLSSQRTPGYPLFLRIVQSAIDHPCAVPFAHWLVLMVASLIFYRGLIQVGYRPSTAMFAAGSIMLSRGVLKFGQLITADSLAISLSIASAGFFFGTLAPRARVGSWVGLTLATFLAYQTRPAYLFLIPLWPLLAFAFDRLILRRDVGVASSVSRGFRYVLATVAPYLAYSLLRLIVVGHFGLVSFGAYNFVGVVGQFLDEATVDALSTDSEPLGREMLDRRAELPGWEPPTDFLTMERMYNPTVWQLAVPAAESVHGDDPVAVNGALSRLGSELLRLHPGQYARWLMGNGWHAVGQIVQLTALDRATLVLLVMMLALHAAALWRGPRPGSVDATSETQLFLERHLVFWTAIAFAGASALLVILVEPANDRYMTGAMTLLPAALAVFAASHLRNCCPSVAALDPER